MKTENTKMTCPDCRGALERIEDGSIVQYRCRVGHLYSPMAAVAAGAVTVENTLWGAVVALEEGADMKDEVARFESKMDADSTEALKQQAQRMRSIAQNIRRDIEAFIKSNHTPHLTLSDGPKEGTTSDDNLLT